MSAIATTAVGTAASTASVVFRGGGRTDIVAVPRREPAAGEVMVRLHGCGVGASNVPMWEGRPWFEYPCEAGAPGHEGWGEVAAFGECVTGLGVGDPVALLSQHAYASFDVAPAELVARIPDRIASRPLPGEPMGCAVNILRRSAIEPGQWVAIVGIGFIGALLVQLAVHAGARVVALTRRTFALDVARHCGAAWTFNSADGRSAIGSVSELTGGQGCERVIEVAGTQATLDLATALCAEGGRLIIAGYHQDGPRRVDMQQWNWRGLDVINAHERDPVVAARGLRDALAAVAEGTLDPFPLLTHSLPLGQIARAFELMHDRPDGFMKAVVVP